HFGKQRRANRINCRTRRDRIKTSRAQHVPRRHLPAVFIADQTIRFRFVKLVHDLPRARLSLPWLAHVVVEIRHVMTRLVAVRVWPDEAGDVCLFATGGAALSREELIEFVNELLPPSHQSDETTHIVRNEERVLPRVFFSKRKRNLARIERLEPVAVTARAHETGRAIENVLVRLRSRDVALVVLFLTKQTRYLRDAPIVVCVFEHP